MNKEDLRLVADTIRVLSMDGVQKANSGHPGMPLGCADIAAVLWCRILNYNPDNPQWVNRDRFVLSPGHGSMLLYSVLHLCGYNISLDDIKNFRQWESITPGHPEYGRTPGVETTTGPLGQGFANAVGMALASGLLAREFNVKEKIIDHYIYAIVSDGDIMEGISSEAASFAGHLGLGNIIFIYDSNEISIEGSTSLTFSEDVAGRFTAYNWHVQKIDGHNYEEIEKAVLAAKKETGRPSIIIARTTIGKGCQSAEGNAECHGAPLGEDSVKCAKKNIGFNPDLKFEVPGEVRNIFADRKKDLNKTYVDWTERFERVITGELKAKWNRFFEKPDISSLRKKIPGFDPAKKIATRSASGKVLEALFRELPNIVGGSADLSPSNKSFVKGFDETGKNKIGRNIHFGIREHAMGAVQNGIAYYGGFYPYTATFFVFLDYMRPPVRLAALSGLQSIYVFTHDSIFVGEDGPTHQPVEHLASARAIPNLTVIRPADAEETVEAWLAAIENSTGPTALVLTRQDMPVIKKDFSVPADLHKGAYVIYDCPKPDILLLSSGSEVHISIEASEKLKEKGIMARVISFPSWELFEKQTDKYKKEILPQSVGKRAVIELGLSMGWQKYAGMDGLYITKEDFGASAPYQVLAEKFGFTVDNIVTKVIDYLRKK